MLALALGIFAADALALAPGAALAPAVAGGALAACALRRPRLRFAAALCIAWAAGALSLSLRFAAATPVPAAPTTAVVEARIAERTRLPGGGLRLLLRELREVEPRPAPTPGAQPGPAGESPPGGPRPAAAPPFRLPRAVHLYAPGPPEVDGAAKTAGATEISGPPGAGDPPQIESAAQIESVTEIGAVPLGSRVRAALVMQAAPGLRNPGGRDARRALARRGIGARARLKHPRLFAVVAPPRCPPCAALAARRQAAAQRLEAEGRGGALLAALSLGARSGLPQPLQDAAGRTGLAHLLAVSGLHLALVAGAAFAPARLVLAFAPGVRRDARRLALLAALAAGLVYGWLAGFGVPMRRALVFLAAWGAASAARRPIGNLSRLAWGACAVLVWDPAALFSPGAQLSFAAAAGLMLGRGPASSTADAESAPHGAAEGAPRGMAWLRGWAALALDVWPRGRAGPAGAMLLRTSAGAVAATAPLAAHHFGGASPIGWLANLLAVPLTALVLLPLALCAAALALLAPNSAAAAWLLPAAAQVGELAAAAMQSWARHAPAASAAAPAPWLFFAAALLALPTLRARRTLWRLFGALAICLAVALGPSAPLHPPPPRVVFLDVGHGDAVLVQGRRAAVLVDAGAAWPHGPDYGAFSVLPALRALGVRRLDLAVLSHGDLDHRGGLPSVLRGVPTALLWLPPGGRGDPALAELRAAARAHGTQIAERGLGAPPQQVGDLLLRPLWPPRGVAAPVNERSLVLEVSLTSGGRRLLLTGDIGARSERTLLAYHTAPGAREERGARDNPGAPVAPVAPVAPGASGVRGARGARGVRGEVLKLAHHGSRTSSHAKFLDAVAPRLAIVSAPLRGRFGMPHPEVTSGLSARRIPWLWTGRDGAVLIPLEGPLCARRFATPPHTKHSPTTIPTCRALGGPPPPHAAPVSRQPTARE